MWMIILLSLCNILALVMSLASCLCCWKRRSPKNELLGLDGMVTQKNPDENVNHLVASGTGDAVQNVESVSLKAVNVGDDHDKRPVAVSNPRRSLPDIPYEGNERNEPGVSWEPQTDNSSDLYASVEQYQSSSKRSATLPNGVDVRPSISQQSSMSQADESFSPYARVNYDKLDKEHPYARLQNIVNSHLEEDGEEDAASSRLLRTENRSPTDSIEPNAPPRSRRSSAQSVGHADIPAASAVAGGVAASQELPYMTPPVAQTNFSGDSQDSSKGYTSITVREPLANIIAQTKEMNKLKRDDAHYSTVSDDSDDVYTTIPDPNVPGSMSGSETYARIFDHTVEAVVNPTPPLEDDVEALYEPPPSNIRRSSIRTHSRQASSSSSVLNLGSPKPEKRQANSPLPPPPMSSSPDGLILPKNLDDMYAKVHKKKRDGVVEAEAAPEVRSVISEIDGKPLRREHNYETLKKSSLPRKSGDGYERVGEEPGYASINGPESLQSTDPGYEVLKQKSSSDCDPNYERLRHRPSDASTSDGYSRISGNQASYSVVKKGRSKNGSNDPDYESMPSESDPNYAALKSNTDSESDPNYESVMSLDPPYERLSDDSSRTDSDLPGYEKIKLKTDGYETVNNTMEPPYEQVDKSDDTVPGYETVRSRATTSVVPEETDDEVIIQV